ncbi:MAG: universal stress protein [Flavobacteriales bacterium]|nr:universal stress protein [Flavobacteriales bacterium]MCB9447735.1 universal stress protein [Flavobacteriales bacterium]
MDASTKQILVPVDFTDQSLIALSQSYKLAKMLDAEITLLKVIEQHGFLSGLFQKHEDEVTAEIQSKLDALVKQTEEKAGVRVNSLIAKGKPYEKILEVAGMINTVLIMMGTSGGAPGLKGMLIGSNALHIVRQTSCPVITIRGKHHRDGCDLIVLPLDLTKETKQKVDKAVMFAKMFDAKIAIVSAMFTKDEFIVNKLNRQMQQVKAFIQERGISCNAEIVKGLKGQETEADVIVDYAKRVEGDLIVIMTQQETEMTDLFLGSTAQRIISESDIPVLSLVPEKVLDGGNIVTPY